MIIPAAIYAAATAFLFILGLNQLWLAWRHHANGGMQSRPDAPEPTEWPMVTVQLPVYNERFVVERLIDAVAAFNYPLEKLEIQVLDDSTDDTTALIAKRVSFWKERGIRMVHVRRDSRNGYKAGALAHGLASASGEFIAVFDADFVPLPGFLRTMIPVIAADKKLGLVQARWGHLNASESSLTRVQAALLDTHFVVEQDVRNASGFFMNFNGTAGIWRRSCIEDAGGWQHDTLTEDLDLSYRAQLAGWRFRFLGDVVAPAELPHSVAVWRKQQFRWTKGTVETSRKLLLPFLRAPLSLRVKLQGLLHLGGFFVFPAILIAVLLHAPLLVARAAGAGPGDLYFALLGLGIIAFAGVVFGHITAQKALYPNWKARLRYEPILLAASLGLAVNNTRGLVEALIRHRTPFVRTPKSGGVSGQSSYAPTPEKTVLWLERGFAVYSLLGLVALVVSGAWIGVGFQLLFVAGFGMLGFYDSIAQRQVDVVDEQIPERSDYHVPVRKEAVSVSLLHKAKAA